MRSIDIDMNVAMMVVVTAAITITPPCKYAGFTTNAVLLNVAARLV